MSSRNGGKLRLWPEDFGLGSVEPVGLQALTYARINNANIEIQYGTLPQWAPIPSYTDESGVYVTQEEIFLNMRTAFGDILDTDHKYYAEKINKIKTYKKYVDEQMGSGTFLIFWQDQANFNTITKPYYMSVIPFPCNYMYMRKAVKRTKEMVKCLMIPNSTDVPNESVRVKMEGAEQCLRDLGEILSNNLYFMGKHPCSLDAVVFGYLAPIYYIPFPNGSMRMKLQEYANLNSFILRMTKSYFSDVVPGNYYVQLEDEDNDCAPWWQIVLAGSAAFTAMVWFAHSQGIIKFIR